MIDAIQERGAMLDVLAVASDEELMTVVHARGICRESREDKKRKFGRASPPPVTRSAAKKARRGKSY